ncbi:MAG: hypothetical protein PHU34_11520 [Candidatus Methanoperedens sp.]|nr:hypothetical protein [Candidatus Methanoperedens sp.]
MNIYDEKVSIKDETDILVSGCVIMKKRNFVYILFLTVFAAGLFAVNSLWTNIGIFFGILVGLGFYDVYVREKIDTI